MLSYPDAENRCFFPVSKGQSLPFVCKTVKRSVNTRPIYFLLLWIQDTQEFEQGAFISQALNGKYAGQIFSSLPLGYRENTLRGELELGNVKNRTTPMGPFSLDLGCKVLNTETCEWVGIRKHLANTGVRNGYQILQDNSWGAPLLGALPGTIHPYPELDWTEKNNWTEFQYSGPQTNTKLVLTRTDSGNVTPIMKYKYDRRTCMEKKRKMESQPPSTYLGKRAKPAIKHDEHVGGFGIARKMWNVFPEPVSPEQVLGNGKEIKQLLARLCSNFDLPQVRGVVMEHGNYYPTTGYWREQGVAVFPESTSTIAQVLDLFSSQILRNNTESLTNLLSLLDLIRERQKLINKNMC